MHPAAFVPRATSLFCVLLFAWVLLVPRATGAQPVLEGVRAGTQSATQDQPSLDPARLLERIRGASVVIRRSAPLVGSGSVVSGFVIGGGRILTSLAALDATDVPEFLGPNGVKLAVPGVIAMDRREGWAILASTSTAAEPLPRAPGAFKDNDRCFVLGRLPDGDEVIGRGTVVTGRRSGRPHCVAEFTGARPVPGSPILNAAGDVAAIAGTWMPQSGGPMHRVIELDLERPAGLSTPVIPLPPPSAGQGVQPWTLESLRRGAALLAPVVTGHVSEGGFSRDMAAGNRPVPVDECDVFARGDTPSIYVFVRWAPTAPLEGDLVLRVFDERNALLSQSPASQMKLKRGGKLFQNWRMGLPVRTGEYRFDVSIGPAVYWRSYAKVTDPEASLDSGAASDTPPPHAESSAPGTNDGVIRPPRKLVDVQPMYPVSAQNAKLQGEVVIDATVDPTGEVTDAKVLTSIPGLDNAALQAVRQWRFTATLHGGVPVPVVMTTTSKFALH